MQKRILIIRTDRVGDAVMITPMIREIRRTFPDAYIGTLTQPHTSAIFANNPHLNVILTDDLKKESFKSVIKEIRKHKFTHALLTWPFERAAYQLFLAGIRTRVGVGRKLYEVITFMKTVSRNNYIPIRHEADYCMDLARRIGVVTDNITPEIFVTEQEKLSAARVLEKAGVTGGHIKIIIHTGSGNSAPNWSEEKYFLLIKELIKIYGARIKILLTSPEASPAFKTRVQSQELNGAVTDVSSSLLELRQLITVIAQTHLVISSSTGPMHLASALGVHTVSLFCHRAVSRPARWGALGNKAVNLEVSSSFCDAHCSPDKETCAIEDGIAVERVIDAVRGVIGSHL